MKRVPFVMLIVFPIVLLQCSGENSGKSASGYETSTIGTEDLQPIITFEEDSISQPADIAVLPNGNLAILDFQLKKVFLHDEQGSYLSSFGREGKGPGEFVRPQALESTGKHLYVGDPGQNVWQKFTTGGSFVETIDDVWSDYMSTRMHVINDNEYLLPANGRGGHLLQYLNAEADTSLLFGEAKGDSSSVVKFQENLEQAKSGEIPDMFKNMVFLQGDDEAHYTFLRSYGTLHKYDLEGSLLFRKQLELPFMKTIRDEFTESNKTAEPGVITMLTYAYDMRVAPSGIFILMNAGEEMNQVLLQLDHNGAILHRYDIAYSEGTLNRMALSNSGERLFLVDSGLGRVFTVSLRALSGTG